MFDIQLLYIFQFLLQICFLSCDSFNLKFKNFEENEYFIMGRLVHENIRYICYSKLSQNTLNEICMKMSFDGSIAYSFKSETLKTTYCGKLIEGKCCNM